MGQASCLTTRSLPRSATAYHCRPPRASVARGCARRPRCACSTWYSVWWARRHCPRCAHSSAHRALISAADTTLPHIRAAQARSRLDAAADEAAALVLGGLPRASGRLADSDVVQLAAEGLAPHANAVSLTLEGLTAIIANLDLPSDIEADVAMTALVSQPPHAARTVAVMVTVTLTLTPTYTQVGQLPSLAMSELRAELAANPAVAAPAAPLASTHAAGATADATVERNGTANACGVPGSAGACGDGRVAHARPGNRDAERATIKPPPGSRRTRGAHASTHASPRAACVPFVV